MLFIFLDKLRYSFFFNYYGYLRDECYYIYIKNNLKKD